MVFGLIKKAFKGVKKSFKSVFKRIKKVVKPIGRALKKGLGKIGKFFGKLGPLGTLALSLMLPGLGTLWSQFGSWASTLSGPLGAVMKGVAAAGNTIGKVYSSVTGMVKDTIGTIAGNTIGKIPVGAGKNLTDVYRGFTTWVGNTMDNLRMKSGLPTKNVTPTTAMEDATKLGEEVANLQDMAPKLGDTSDMINIKMKEPSLLSSTDGGIPTVSAPEFTIEPTGKPSASLKEYLSDTMKYDATPTTKVITGFEKTPVKVGQVELESLTPTYKEIATDALTSEQIAMNERLTNYTNYLDKYNQSITESATIPFKTETGKIDYKINPDFSQKDLLVAQGKDIADFGQKAFTAQSIIAGEPQGPEMQQGYAVPYSQLELQTDITTTNDYAKAYGQQYTAQGYQGPMTVEGFASAGYYGGDPFSFGQYLNARPIVGPQPNVII